MCAGPHTGRHENGARAGADMECGAPAPLLRGGPRSRAADREDGAADREDGAADREDGAADREDGAADREAARKTPGVVTEPPAGNAPRSGLGRRSL